VTATLGRRWLLVIVALCVAAVGWVRAASTPDRPAALAADAATAAPTDIATSTTASSTTTAVPTSTSTTTTSTAPTTPTPMFAAKGPKKAKVDVPVTTTTTSTVPPVAGYQPTVWPPFTPAGPLEGVAALTGEPAGADVTNRAALAVKIDNSRPARPQWNVDVADVIFEENVEGITRFIAVFHTRLPAEAGPVRSSRTSDLSILAAMNRPILAWSGGNPAVTAEVTAAAQAGVVVDLSALRINCYRRESSRRAPHNLLLDPACAHQRVAGGPARPLWSYDADWQPGAAAFGPDTTFDVPMDGVRVTWEWDPSQQRYLRSQDGMPHVAANGNQIAVTNVVTLYVAHVPSRADGRSPEAVTVGSGQLMVHRDGVATAGTWERARPYDPFTFRDGEGRVIPLRPGTTFVQLARAG
jgi:Protein of unknown function (DUF3048) N-terminal domain/Protein of unknown function (DUF3048) C-terminal domain